MAHVPQADSAPPAPLPLPLSGRATRTGESPITQLMARALTSPTVISFAPGLVDFESLPVDLVSRAQSKVLASAGKQALQYGTTAGLPRLRQWMVEHLAELENLTADQVAREMSVTADDVVVTTGSQQALLLIGDVLLDPGDLVIAGGPSYFVCTNLFESLGAEVLTVPANEGGMDLDALKALVDQLEEEGRLHKLKLVYVQPFFANPTGLCLAEERREPLVKLVEEVGWRVGHRVLLLEDAAYRELYHGDTSPGSSLKRYDHQNSAVASCYTFSKPLSPGMKTGYAFLPKGLVEPVLSQKGNHDFGSPNICQHVLAELTTAGDYDRHVAGLREMYAGKCQAMLAALDRELGETAHVTWTRPGGGMFVWLTLPDIIQTGQRGTLLDRCLDADVMYVPGELCYAGAQRPASSMRLCFGSVDPSRIDEGVRRLASAIKDELASSHARSRTPEPAHP